MKRSKTCGNRACCAPSITYQGVNEQVRHLGKAPSIPGPVSVDNHAAEPFPNNKETKDCCSLMLLCCEVDLKKKMITSKLRWLFALNQWNIGEYRRLSMLTLALHYCHPPLIMIIIPKESPFIIYLSVSENKVRLPIRRQCLSSSPFSKREASECSKRGMKSNSDHNIM